MTDEPIPPAPPDDIEALKRENAELRYKLERSKELNRLNTQALLADNSYEPMTQEEIHEMLHGPRGRSPWEILEEFEQKHLKDES
jgi:hypothetical protein